MEISQKDTQGENSTLVLPVVPLNMTPKVFYFDLEVPLQGLTLFFFLYLGGQDFLKSPIIDFQIYCVIVLKCYLYYFFYFNLYFFTILFLFLLFSFSLPFIIFLLFLISFSTKQNRKFLMSSGYEVGFLIRKRSILLYCNRA